MKPRKNLILTMLLALTLAASVTGMAQTPAQGDQKEKTHACCSMDTCCCCNGDSCEMKTKDEMAKDGTKKESCCNMKHKHPKEKAKQKAA
jgi:hypothetical protein